MKRFLLSTALAAMVVFPARAELKVGEVAPPFTADAARAGKGTTVTLGEALSRGPVILYFYPQGPSETCYVENYEFSFVADRLDAAGITILGVSSDRLPAVLQTSRLECSDKITLASDPTTALIQSYAAQDAQRPEYASSVGYVIAPNGRIIYAWANHSKNAVEHVADLVRAAETWVAGQTR